MSRRENAPHYGLWAVSALATLLLGFWLLSWYWSLEPAPLAKPAKGQQAAKGVATTDNLIKSIQVLLNKPGGFISNDVMPPGDIMDNMPSWEYGALIQLRDFTHVLRDEISRSQSQSVRDPDLAVAEPKLNIQRNSWAFPRAEGAYGDAIEALKRYRDRLNGKEQPTAHFYVRARNLKLWLELVSQRLGSLAEQLELTSGEAATRPIINTGGKAPVSKSLQRISWWQSDNIFYKARGASWALLNLCRGIEVDFHDVLVQKHALSSFDNLEEALKAAQRPMYSPMVMTGDDFGIFANHTLTLASFLASANTTVINLQRLMQQD